MKFFKKVTFLTVLIWIFFTVTHLWSQQYVVQAGDKLNITFWQDPTLNTISTVGQDGTITLPVIGQMKAAGLNAAQLSKQIIERMSRYRLKVTQASVVVTEYNSNKIYVTGQVRTPGAYSFEVIPNLWQVLQEAGGALETARLDNITIVRAGKGKGEILQVDLTEYFSTGELTKLPKLNGGDTIHVPAISIAVAAQTGRDRIRAGGLGASSPFLSRNEIYIVGEVAAPGRYNFEKEQNLLDALVLAGGPTQTAKLSEVRIFNRLQGNSGMITINLKDYLNSSEPEPLFLHPGDTIYVPRKAQISPFFSRVVSVTITATITALLFAWLGQR